jgi:hypothetical protein
LKGGHRSLTCGNDCPGAGTIMPRGSDYHTDPWNSHLDEMRGQDAIDQNELLLNALGVNNIKSEAFDAKNKVIPHPK